MKITKACITKSRAGHYTVTIWSGNRRVFRRNLLPTVFRAREILRAEKERIAALPDN